MTGEVWWAQRRAHGKAHGKANGQRVGCPYRVQREGMRVLTRLPIA
ncbi:hypothetical protein BLA18112_04173 [Burkholderia lata]|uniref:Uncharacterized protein n=1 Tax=Burkholderia lata (strain ATCC 17760 / DSM 23089 / LMG 22485 / NCIMB 9086 / R18194 / 383) TaxID=482957 RepID=A0A6P2X5E1_BURL3|nr:hypothetical protein BLA18112_04173 [Burkholderia lata]